MRAIIALAGAAMVASFFLTWLEIPFAGPDLSPFGVVMDRDLDLLGLGDWRSWVFLGGFACAALAVLGGGGLMALLAGIGPLVVLGSLWADTSDLRALTGSLPVDAGDLRQAAQILGDFARAGLYAYAGSAVVLVIAGLSRLVTPR